jgi:hypothetical protein
MREACKLQCPIQIHCRERIEEAETLIQAVEEIRTDMKQTVKKSIEQSDVFAPFMRNMYVESAPIEQVAYEAYKGIISANVKRAEFYADSCFGPIAMRRYLIFGEKVIRCTSLAQLFDKGRLNNDTAPQAFRF